MSSLEKFRKDLHANPELSEHEVETQKRIRQFLAENGIENPIVVGGTGLIYTFHFGAGPSLLVRVDCDALPIEEINDFEHKSRIAGVSHKCGHDGHTTIGAGLAIKLNENPLSAGTVHILFQPAEENGAGAASVIKEPAFKALKIDHTVALHNIPGAPLHQVIWKKGSFTPAVQSLILKLNGKTSHAAQPLKGRNPAYAIAEIIQYAQEHEQLNEEHENFHLLTPIFSSLGSKDYGISAGYGELHFTIRSWNQNRMERATADLTEAAQRVAKKYQLTVERSIIAAFAVNENNADLVDHITHSAVFLGLQLEEKKEAFPWGEDFGLFTQRIPGAMFGLGAGESTPALHNPDYDYPDELTETGVELFYQIAKNILND